jgi:3-oxoacyl-[acyl-carrier protein] reductase
MLAARQRSSISVWRWQRSWARGGITVNTVSPGVTETDGLVLDREQVNQMIAQTPLGRLGHPDDIASAVAMLVSDDAHWVTGQSIRANGGIV